jgi:hypothetical protein
LITLIIIRILHAKSGKSSSSDGQLFNLSNKTKEEFMEHSKEQRMEVIEEDENNE